MPKKEAPEAQAIATLDCGYRESNSSVATPFYTDEKREGYTQYSTKNKKIEGHTEGSRMSALVILYRNGTLKLLCPWEKNGVCNMREAQEAKKPIKCPYKSILKKEGK